jgi:hypothetical protein
LVNWVHSKILIWRIVRAWKNQQHFSGNWVHSKTLIWRILPACKNYQHLLPIECMNLDLNYCSRLDELPMSIWQLNALQNFDLKYYSSL